MHGHSKIFGEEKFKKVSLIFDEINEVNILQVFQEKLNPLGKHLRPNLIHRYIEYWGF